MMVVKQSQKLFHLECPCWSKINKNIWIWEKIHAWLASLNLRFLRLVVLSRVLRHRDVVGTRCHPAKRGWIKCSSVIYRDVFFFAVFSTSRYWAETFLGDCYCRLISFLIILPIHRARKFLLWQNQTRTLHFKNTGNKCKRELTVADPVMLPQRKIYFHFTLDMLQYHPFVRQLY